ncbi:MAG: S-methyl-5-thioribose-1-phosphate isomerase [Bacteroidia bacterium]|nr:S-methyl-5-thioribose-1-phosphate isomerase [Bacteroidia bacterium]
MKVNGIPRQSIWVHPQNPEIIQIIDQRQLPHEFVVEDLRTPEDAAVAIREMHVRGAPLIGVTAAYGMYLALLQMSREGRNAAWLASQAKMLGDTRPTAVNLQWAIERMLDLVATGGPNLSQMALQKAIEIEREDAGFCKSIGENGVKLIAEIAARKDGPVNILTHCNAGWLATVDWGTATSPIYHAYDAGIPIHVWVEETRPRNQGGLTAWELGQHGVPHTVIVDNTGGHLMQHGMVDMCIVGSDRTTYTGDVANKIGTYLKALAAHDNGIPFYVALPFSTFDWTLRDGLKEIPIETRTPDEVKQIRGWADGKMTTVDLFPASSPAVNYGFDVTPARLVTGLITERGICEANERSILNLYPEYAPFA